MLILIGIHFKRIHQYNSYQIFNRNGLINDFLYSNLHADVLCRLIFNWSQCNNITDLSAVWFLSLCINWILFLSHELIQIVLYLNYFSASLKPIFNWHSNVHYNQFVCSFTKRILALFKQILFVLFYCHISVTCFIYLQNNCLLLTFPIQ